MLFANFFFAADAQKCKGWVSRGGIFGTHYFIENKGQYKQLQHQVKDVLYAVQDHDEIYFTKTGFTFHLVKMTKIKKEKEGKKEDEEAEEIERAKAFKNRKEEWVEMKWLNANPNVEVIAEEKSHHYFTYGTADLNSYGYKKLTYKNLYNGIDIVIELHPKGGIKYTVIAASAAALKQYQFEYTAANKALKTKLINNQLYLINQCDTLIETGLTAKDETGNAIAMQYKMANHLITFDAPNVKGKIIIDPWVNTINSFNLNEIGYDVDFDKFSNLFVYGDDGCVSKYNSSGTLLWTFLGAVPSIIWSWGGYAGNFVVDKLTSKTYCSQGTNFGGTQVIRLDANGNYDNFVSVANTSFQEIWEMKFNCSTGQLIGMGGGINSNLNFGIIDTTSGFVTTLNVTTLGLSNQDIANAVIDNNGYPYLVFADIIGPPNNYIYKVTNNYTSVIWDTLTGFNNLNESNNKPFVGFGVSNGINVLAANSQYLFYYDGYNLKAFNATNGAPVGAPLIVDVNYLPKHQAGIVTNNCNEVYIGGDNGNILKCHFNGSTFSILDTLIISGQSGNKVHDMMYNSSNRMLYVCGDNFVSVINPLSICADSTLHLTISTRCPDTTIVSIVSSGAAAYSYTFTWKDSISGSVIKTITKPTGVLHDTLLGSHSDSIILVKVVRNSPCQIVANEVQSSLHCAKQKVSICQGQSYTFSNGHGYGASGSYLDTLNTYVGIHDSIVFLQLIVYPVFHDTVGASICQYQYYILPKGTIVNASGVYNDTLMNHFGCDSIITTILKVRPISQTTVQASICSNQTYILPKGTIVNTANIYKDTLINFLGCDSIITTFLQIKPISQATVNAAICSNQTYTLPKGALVNTANTYIDTLQNFVGCDSIITTFLQVKSISQTTVHLTICSNQTYTLPNGTIVDLAGIYVVTFQNRFGCDSIITTILTVITTHQPPIHASICNNQNYILPNGVIANHAGTYVDTLTNHLGCDSIITTTLFLKPVSYATIHATFCLNHTYTLPNGNIVTQPGIYIDTTFNHVGCDSIVTTYLTQVGATYAVINDSFCVNKSYLLPNGQSTNIAGNYTVTITNYLGCDSIITVHLKEKLLSFSVQQVSICSNNSFTLPNGQTTNIAGTYTDTVTAANGCDSIVFTDLAVHPFSSVSFNPSICDNQQYTLPNGIKTNQSGTYVDSFKTAYHCDSVIIVHLTVAAMPKVKLGNDTTLCSDKLIVLNATNPQATYQWNDWSNQPIKTATVSGLYSVQIQNPPCPTVEDSIRIAYVDCENCGIAIPSAFTPNGDGINDKFRVQSNCLLSAFHLFIYNRWGQKVFESTDINAAWDGTLNGVLQPVSVFVYQVAITKSNGETKSFQGNLSLLK